MYRQTGSYRAASRFSSLAQAGGRTDVSIPFQPLQGLSGGWLSTCANTVELRLAAALAGIGGMAPGQQGHGHIRQNIEAVEWDDRRHRWIWAATSPAVVWSEGPLPQVLERILARRCLDAAVEGTAPLPLHSRWPASLADIERFLLGTVDEGMLADLLWALCGLSPAEMAAPPGDTKHYPATLPRAYAHLKLVFLSQPVREVNPAYEPAILPMLRARNVGEACLVAARRLHASGLRPLADQYFLPPDQAGRLGAALLFPVADATVEQCAAMVLHAPE